MVSSAGRVHGDDADDNGGAVISASSTTAPGPRPTQGSNKESDGAAADRRRGAAYSASMKALWRRRSWDPEHTRNMLHARSARVQEEDADGRGGAVISA